MFGLSVFQTCFPLAFENSFTDMMLLVMIIMENSLKFSIEVVKASLICSIKVLKQFIYYAEGDHYLLTVSKSHKEFLLPI